MRAWSIDTPEQTDRSDTTNNLDEWLPNCEGLVLPAPPGTPVDALRWRNVLRRRDRALVLAEDASKRPEEPLASTSKLVAKVLEHLPPLLAAEALDSPYAAWDVPPPAVGLETVVDPRPGDTRLLALARHLVGVADVDTTIVFPPETFAAGPLRLPHLGVVVTSEGPLAAIQEDDDMFLLVWDDGTHAIVPRGGPRLEVVPSEPLLGGRLRVAPSWTGRVLEPSTADVAAAFVAFGPAGATEIPLAKEVHRAALDLLRAVWPVAADAADRWLVGLMPLASREGTRSHASPRLAGVVLSSATDPVTAGDILCHELAHIRLAALLEHDPLLENGREHGHQSPWRRDPRPLLGVLLGVHAFLDVCIYHRRIVDSGLLPGYVAASESLYARQVQNIRLGWELLQEVAVPTPAGVRVLQALDEEVAAL